jgi:hypothetical protein
MHLLFLLLHPTSAIGSPGQMADVGTFNPVPPRCGIFFVRPTRAQSIDATIFTGKVAAGALIQ